MQEEAGKGTVREHGPLYADKLRCADIAVRLANYDNRLAE